MNNKAFLNNSKSHQKQFTTNSLSESLYFNPGKHALKSKINVRKNIVKHLEKTETNLYNFKF